MTRQFWRTLALVAVVGVMVGVAARTARSLGAEAGRGAVSAGREPHPTRALDEQAFLDEMISHHRTAVALATAALGRTERPEIRLLAHGLVARHEHEITEMKSWRVAWFADEADAGGSDGHTPQHTIRAMDTADPALTPDEDFDATFISLMLTHHAEVLIEAEDMLMAGPREEIMLLAERISGAYAAEIGDLQQWRDEWFSSAERARAAARPGSTR